MSGSVRFSTNEQGAEDDQSDIESADMSLAEELPTATNPGNDRSVMNTAQLTDPQQAMSRSTQQLMRNQIVQAFNNEEMPSNLLKPSPEEESKYEVPSSMLMLENRGGLVSVPEE